MGGGQAKSGTKHFSCRRFKRSKQFTTKILSLGNTYCNYVGEYLYVLHMCQCFVKMESRLDIWSLPVLSPRWDTGIFWSCCCALDPFHSKQLSLFGSSWLCCARNLLWRGASPRALNDCRCTLSGCICTCPGRGTIFWKWGFGVCVHSAAPFINYELFIIKCRQPFCHQMACRFNWEEFNQTNLDDLVVRVSARFEVSHLFAFRFMQL